MTDTLSGVMVPITTPFDSTTGNVDPVALRSNARNLMDGGASGILAAGSTGEAAMLSEREAQQVIEWLRDVIPDEGTLLAGAGRESTRATIEACTACADAGADAVLVRPPTYYASALTETALIDHFRAIADASPVPVLVYNIPKYTKIALSPNLLAALAGHENIVGAKDSSGDLRNFGAYRDAVPDWVLFVGAGALLYPALELGAAGGILAVANYAIDTCVHIFNSFERGDRQAAGAVQEVLTPLHKEIVASLGPAGVKHAMDLVGLVGGRVRPPLSDLEPRQRDTVAKVLTQSSLTPT